MADMRATNTTCTCKCIHCGKPEHKGPCYCCYCGGSGCKTCNGVGHAFEVLWNKVRRGKTNPYKVRAGLLKRGIIQEDIRA